MTARDDAIETMELEDSHHDYVCSLGQLLDAIPADVLARLAIERGGLVDDGTWVVTDDGDDYLVHYEDEDRPDSAVPLYRIVEVDQ